METKEIYNTIVTKFNLIRDDLDPILKLSELEKEYIKENNIDFILTILNQYASSDIKRFFMLTPEIWLYLSREELIKIFNSIEKMRSPYESFHGLFNFLYVIIRVRMYDLLFKELVFSNESINDFLQEKKKAIMNINQDIKSVELKYINIHENILLKIRTNLSDNLVDVKKPKKWLFW